MDQSLRETNERDSCHVKVKLDLIIVRYQYLSTLYAKEGFQHVLLNSSMYSLLNSKVPVLIVGYLCIIVTLSE